MKISQGIKHFFNYIKNSIDPDFQNPCDNSALRKLFRAGKMIQFKILEKDLVDEIIFRTSNPENRLILEIVSKILLRHSNLSTTQRYLGKISDVEAMRWIDNLHG